MKNDTYKKIIKLITYTMVLALVMINIKDILGILKNFLMLLSPLWIGIGLAYTLNVPMSIIEKKLFQNKSKKSRIISLLISIMFVVLLILVLFIWVIPDFIDSATYLVGQIPRLINDFNDLLVRTFRNSELSTYMQNFSASDELSNMISGVFKVLINNFSSMLSNFVTFVINLLTGIIISVYLLLEKESILKECKTFIHKVFDKKVTKKLTEIFRLSNKSFHDFITYQCLECLVLGTLMFIAFVCFRFPYSLTIAFLTTVTAIIPILGATIACIIGAILIGTVSIKQAIIFVIVYQVIQQIENNIIYPKVVGMHIGLPPIMTIIAIFIGGNIAGFFGMITCIPLTSILYSFFKLKFLSKNTGKKKESQSAT